MDTIVLFKTERLSVSGRVMYDGLGRAIATYHPVSVAIDHTENVSGTYLGSAVAIDFLPFDTLSSIQPQTTSYDILDRPLVVTYSDSTTTSYLYDIAEDFNGIARFRTTITDGNGNSSKVYSDHRQLQTQLTDPLGGNTRFTYDALGQLLQSLDPEDFATNYTYDKGGRCLSRQHPSSGTTSWTYDPAGNITKQTMASSEKITYLYSYNRLNSVEYSDRYWNNVYYAYGDSTAGNAAGRITRLQDATGVQEFEYDDMGNIVHNRHTYVLPNSEYTMTFTTRWDYDSWGRVRRIVYPDQEKVSYFYGLGGKLKSVMGDKNSVTTCYVDSIMYDHYEQRISELSGNGVKTYYDYDPIMRRLSNLANVSLNDNSLLQENTYYYDNVGNIVLIKDGGLNTRVQNYSYDQANRLKSSNGTWSDGTNNLTYANTFKYSLNGRMLAKYATSSRLNNIDGLHNVNYENEYRYDNTGNPHAVRKIENTMTGKVDHYEWDAKGNMTSHYNETGKTKRSLCWTEDNRLQAFLETEGQSAYYNYTASGERNFKFAGKTATIYQNGNEYHKPVLTAQTLYASSLMTITRKGYTKHIFEEGKRICSKIGGGFTNTTLTELNIKVPKVKHDY